MLERDQLVLVKAQVALRVNLTLMHHDGILST